MTPEEAEAVNAAARLLLCAECGLVIEDGDPVLKIRYVRRCRPCGEQYLDAHPELRVVGTNA